MFDDPGAKLKLIAKITFWLMIIACAITGFAIGASTVLLEKKFADSEENPNPVSTAKSYTATNRWGD